MSGLKNCHVIGRIGARRNAHSPNFGRCRVRQIIPVKVHRSDHVKFRRPQLQQLKNDVCNTAVSYTHLTLPTKRIV